MLLASPWLAEVRTARRMLNRAVPREGAPPQAAPEETAAPGPVPINAGRYCSVGEIQGGQAFTEATVRGQGDEYHVAVIGKMPDSDQVLEAGPAKAEVDSDGVLYFSFGRLGKPWHGLVSAEWRASAVGRRPSPGPVGSNIRRTTVISN